MIYILYCYPLLLVCLVLLWCCCRWAVAAAAVVVVVVLPLLHPPPYSGHYMDYQILTLSPNLTYPILYSLYLT